MAGRGRGKPAAGASDALSVMSKARTQMSQAVSGDGAPPKRRKRGGGKGAQTPSLEAARSATTAGPEMSVAKVAWGSTMTCAACGVTSDVADWGQHLKMRSPDGSMGQQPVGGACKAHFLVHQRACGYMTFDEFSTKYQEDDRFRSEVDTGAENLSNPNDLGFMREAVTEEDSHQLLLRSPEYFALKGSEVSRLTNGGDAKKLGLKSMTLPNLDGTEGTSEYFLLAKDEPYPTVQAVATIGAKRARQAQTADKHCFAGQGRLLFHHQNSKRAEATRCAPLFGGFTVETMAQLRERLGISVGGAPVVPAKAGAPATPVAMPSRPKCASEEALIIDDEEPLVLQQATVDGSGIGTGAPFRLRALASPAAAASSAAMQSPESKEAASAQKALQINPDDSISQVGEGTAVSGDGAEPEESKTDYWIRKNNLAQILEGHALGVFEHQAMLRQQKLEAFDLQNPTQQKYSSEISRLRAHLKKVTVCKKMVPASIVSLGEEAFSAALHLLGPDFVFPSVTKQAMVVRACSLARQSGMAGKGTDGQNGMQELVGILTPPVVGKSTPFNPRRPLLKSLDLPPAELCKLFRQELVESSFVCLLVADYGPNREKLNMLCDAILAALETMWEEMEENMTKVVAATVACARVVGYLCGKGGSLPDDDLYREMRGLTSAANHTESKSIKTLIGTALNSNADLAFKLQQTLDYEKNVLMGGPVLTDAFDILGGFGGDSLDIGYASAIAACSKAIVTWKNKLPEEFMEPLESKLRERVMDLCRLAMSATKSAQCTSAQLSAIQNAVGDAGLVFSLDSEMATLQHDLFHTIATAGNSMKIQKTLDLGGAMLQKYAAVLAAGGQQPTPDDFWEAAAKVREAMLELRGVNFDSKQRGQVADMLSKLLEFAGHSFDPKCEVLCEIATACEWLGLPLVAKVAALLSAGLSLQMAHKEFVDSNTGADDDMNPKATTAERANLCYETVLSKPGDLESFSPLFGPGAKVAVLREGFMKTMTEYKERVAENRKKVFETTVGEVLDIDWKVGLAKNAGLQTILKAWETKGLRLADLRAKCQAIEKATADFKRVFQTLDRAGEVGEFEQKGSKSLASLRLVLFEGAAAQALSDESKEQGRVALVKALTEATLHGLSVSCLAPPALKRAAENRLKFRS